MPKGVKKTSFDLPANLKVQFVEGQSFIRVRAAAKLAGIPEAVLEMGRKLLERPGQQAASFLLGTPEMQKRGNEIEAVIVSGLRKVARALGPGGLSVRCYRDGDKLSFWLQAGGPGLKKAASS